MFDTVIPAAVARRPRRRSFYETLPVSIALHAIAGGTIAVSSVWSVDYPSQAPSVAVSFQLAAAPAPPAPPPPPPRAAAVQTVKIERVEQTELAPTVIPDQIAPVVEEPTAGSAAGVAGGVEGGVEGGEIGGVVGGVAGGVVIDAIHAPPPAVAAPNVIEIARDADLPLEVVDRGYPEYPLYAQLKGWEDTVVVRYIIATDGRVRDVIVLQPPEREAFARATLKRLRQWRFRPYRDASGVAREVMHELTVEFRLVAK